MNDQARLDLVLDEVAQEPLLREAALLINGEGLTAMLTAFTTLLPKVLSMDAGQKLALVDSLATAYGRARARFTEVT